MEQKEINEEQLLEDIVNRWIVHSAEHPEISAGLWLRSFGIMSGITLGISGTPEELAKTALAEVVNIAARAYYNTLKELPPATLQ